MPALACQPGEGGSFYLQRRQAVQGRAFYRHARQQGCQVLQNMVVKRPAAAHDQMLPGACASVPGFAKAESAARGTAGGTARKRPNLILFVTDDQAWDLIGYETPQLKTPNLARLARHVVVLPGLETGRGPGRWRRRGRGGTTR